MKAIAIVLFIGLIGGFGIRDIYQLTARFHSAGWIDSELTAAGIPPSNSTAALGGCGCGYTSPVAKLRETALLLQEQDVPDRETVLCAAHLFWESVTCRERMAIFRFELLDRAAPLVARCVGKGTIDRTLATLTDVEVSELADSIREFAAQAATACSDD